MRLKKITTKEGEIYFVNSKTDERIKTNNSNSFLYSTPSGVLAFLTLIAVTIIMFIIGSLLESYDKQSIIAYIMTVILLSTGCFIIIRINPKSVWYVPFICNAFLILSAFVEPNFWRGIMWIIICPGWILSIIASVFGAQIGKRNIKIKHL